MNTKACALTATLLLLALAPLGVQAAHEGPLVTRVVNDLFDVVDVEDIEFTGGCGGGEFEVLPEQNAFRFYEIPESTRFFQSSTGQNVASPTGGYEATGCGTASYPVRLPNGLDHFHVRFNASRTIDVADDGEALDYQVEQSLNVRTAIDVNHATREYFDRRAPSSDGSVYVDPPSFEPVAGQISIDWYFEEVAAGNQQTFPNVVSGVAVEATVETPIIEYSYVPADGRSVTESTVQTGSDVVTEAVVISTLTQATLDTFDRVNVRVQTQASPDLVRVIMPDGTVIEETATRQGAGDSGYDPNRILVEHFQGYSWYTIPYGLVEQHGVGDYTFVIQESQGLTVSGGLVPVALLVGVLPLVASAFAIVGTLRFRREAFGGFKRAATGLVGAIAALLTYYIAVMLSAFFTGTINRMIILPFDSVAWLLYLQVAIAAVGFLIVFFVGRELYRITVPRKSS